MSSSIIIYHQMFKYFDKGYFRIMDLSVYSAGSVCDSEEDMALLIHSQIQRGLQDFQMVKMSFEATKRVRLANSFSSQYNEKTTSSQVVYF